MKTNALHGELTFRTSRSSGSGGQHVNKVATRVELLFNVLDSAVLNDADKQRILAALANRINREGILQVAAEASRSQLQNKMLAIKKFDALISKALRPVKERPAASAYVADRNKRLRAKKRLAERKANRQKVRLDH